jgi:outer membrane murein-binding lipoprotein Lpp
MKTDKILIVLIGLFCCFITGCSSSAKIADSLSTTTVQTSDSCTYRIESSRTRLSDFIQSQLTTTQIRVTFTCYDTTQPVDTATHLPPIAMQGEIQYHQQDSTAAHATDSLTQQTTVQQTKVTSTQSTSTKRTARRKSRTRHNVAYLYILLLLIIYTYNRNKYKKS